MLVTAVLVQKHPAEHDWELGSLLFRRAGFSVLESIFHKGKDKHMDEFFTLSRQSINELINFMILGPLFQTDFASRYLS